MCRWFLVNLLIISLGFNSAYLRWQALRWVQKLPFRILTFSLIISDLILIIIDLILDCPPTPASRTIGSVDMAISCYFVLEIILRIYALTPKVREVRLYTRVRQNFGRCNFLWCTKMHFSPKVFFSRRSWFNIVDFIVVFLTFIISICYTVIVEQLVKEGAFQVQ